MSNLTLKDFHNDFISYLPNLSFKNLEELKDTLYLNCSKHNFIVREDGISGMVILEKDNTLYSYQIVNDEERILLISKWKREAK